MKLVFEISREGRSASMLPELDVANATPQSHYLRAEKPLLPQVAEIDLARHYQKLSTEVFGVTSGFYPLGSCTMKYNPIVNEELSALPGFSGLHPLQPTESVQGALELMYLTEKYLAEITGMDAVTLQPAAGAQGEYAGILLIRAFHNAANDFGRTKIIVPDSAHGTNPATAAMAGFETLNIPSNEDGTVNLEALCAAVGPDTAGLMLTNPNTVGVFDPHIEKICQIVHEAGGLCYYDGANLNPIMGITRPGDMGFDCVHLNLHKTFSTPHGGGGPGSGPVGCKKHLAQFLPAPIVEKDEDSFYFAKPCASLGRMKSFYGNFAVVVRALAYILRLGKSGIPKAAQTATLNANYLMEKLKKFYTIAYPGPCMHEFVIDVDPLKKETGYSALDIAKRLLDFGIHPPTMYFPLIVHEALMVEPTETESRETLDDALDIFFSIWEEAHSDSIDLHQAPFTTSIRRPDEVRAARNPILHWQAEQNKN